jgi:hypothetical protein
MLWQELSKSTDKGVFSPETAAVEALPLFKGLKSRMQLLSWVYEGSLRWSELGRMVRVVYQPGQRAMLELWHMDGSNDLMRRLETECSEQGLMEALDELLAELSPARPQLRR